MRLAALLTLALGIGLTPSLARSQEVLAGSGAVGYFGDGGLAPAAALNRPQAVIGGADGTLYIADAGNHRIRSVSPGGVIATFAGDGNAPLDAAWNGHSLRFPTGLALDSSQRLWIADAEGQRVLRYAPGIGLQLIAGNGQEGPAVPATEDPALSPLLYPVSLLADGERVLASEMGSGRVLSLGASLPAAVMIDGIPSPCGLARDVDGALLVTGLGTGALYRVEGGGASEVMRLPVPTLTEDPDLSLLPSVTSAAVGGDGSLYLAVPNASAILRFTPQGEILPFSSRPTVVRPVGLWFTSDSRLLVADEGRNQVLSFDLPFPVPLPGDPDGDGTVTVNDGVAALQLLVGITPFHRGQFLAADVAPPGEKGQYGDGRLTVEDVVRILRHVAGLESVWP